MIKWAAHDDVADVSLCGLNPLYISLPPDILPPNTRYVTTPGGSG